MDLWLVFILLVKLTIATTIIYLRIVEIYNILCELQVRNCSHICIRYIHVQGIHLSGTSVCVWRATQNAISVMFIDVVATNIITCIHLSTRTTNGYYEIQKKLYNRSFTTGWLCSLLYPVRRSRKGYIGFLLTARPPICRRHRVSQVGFGISISNFMCIFSLTKGRNLLIS